jgi:hypothetical protein
MTDERPEPPDSVTDERPEPPDSVTDGLAERLADCSPETLRDIATYADELAAYRERAGEKESKESDEDERDKPESRPEDVPGKATLTIKEINGNRYYYWQWREGDTVTSQYKGPVSDGQ